MTSEQRNSAYFYKQKTEASNSNRTSVGAQLTSSQQSELSKTPIKQEEPTHQQMAALNYLKKEGIISNEESCETVYLAENEIQSFMENYLKENPGTEIETRYINASPINVTQNVEVRWLRPETPELPPIIIKEKYCEQDDEQRPLRIVQTDKVARVAEAEESSKEPIIYREKPPSIIPQPKVVYVQNLVKKANNFMDASDSKEIKVEHFNLCNMQKGARVANNSRYSVDTEDQTSAITELLADEFSKSKLIDEKIVTYNSSAEENHLKSSRISSLKNKSSDEQEENIRTYEEKVKQSLYEDYLLKLERENLERKLTKEQRLLLERRMNKSVSQEHLLNNSQALSTNSMFCFNSNDSNKEKDNQIYRHHGNNFQPNGSYVSNYSSPQMNVKQNSRKSIGGSLLTDGSTSTFLTSLDGFNQASKNFDCGLTNYDKNMTSSYKTIKFTKITNKDELKRFENILEDPNALTIRNKKEGDQIISNLISVDTNYYNNATLKPEVVKCQITPKIKQPDVQKIELEVKLKAPKKQQVKVKEQQDKVYTNYDSVFGKQFLSPQVQSQMIQQQHQPSMKQSQISEADYDREYQEQFKRKQQQIYEVHKKQVEQEELLNMNQQRLKRINQQQKQATATPVTMRSSSKQPQMSLEQQRLIQEQILKQQQHEILLQQQKAQKMKQAQQEQSTRQQKENEQQVYLKQLLKQQSEQHLIRKQRQCVDSNATKLVVTKPIKQSTRQSSPQKQHQQNQQQTIKVSQLLQSQSKSLQQQCEKQQPQQNKQFEFIKQQQLKELEQQKQKQKIEQQLQMERQQRLKLEQQCQQQIYELQQQQKIQQLEREAREKEEKNLLKQLEMQQKKQEQQNNYIREQEQQFMLQQQQQQQQQYFYEQLQQNYYQQPTMNYQQEYYDSNNNNLYAASLIQQQQQLLESSSQNMYNRNSNQNLSSCNFSSGNLVKSEEDSKNCINDNVKREKITNITSYYSSNLPNGVSNPMPILEKAMANAEN